MLLARRGHRVLLVDRAHFPSDTVSTHYIHQPGVARLKKWGLLDRLTATGLPPITETVWDIQGVRITGQPAGADVPEAYAPRRTVLDGNLVEAAAEAGAEVRESFTVKKLIQDGDRVIGIGGREAGGPMVEERATVVVGADGLRSTVARLVGAATYNERPSLTHCYYSYWSGVQVDRQELYGRVGLGSALVPTNEELVLVGLNWAVWDTPRLEGTIEARYLEGLNAIPEVGERVLAGSREERIAGMANIPNFFRTATGRGWALVGDAGYFKDPIGAQGISDAFRDAELLAEAIHSGLSGAEPVDRALAGYASRRDEEALPWYRWTQRLGKLEELSDPTRAVMEGIAADQTLSDRYCGLTAETVHPDAFFEQSPKNA
jgi:2-polyprenyl-6-methoxyphenol hydroxylase-like FAD-dependent oxidoreductase